MEQNNNSANTVTSIFIQKHSAAIRIWHWLTFLIVISLITTVLLVSTVLSPRENIPMVQNVLKEKGTIIDSAQAGSVAHLYENKMWDIHKLLGYALSFLLLSRILIELTQSKEEKMRSRFKKASLAYKQNSSDKKELRHYMIVKVCYLFFYLLLLAMVTTGLLLVFRSDLGLSRQSGHIVKEIHSFIQYMIYLFVVFHLTSVILADIGKSQGIVSGMINSGK